MERLTEYHAGVAVLKNKEKHKDAMQRLAEYEDIGLEPEQIKEIDKLYFEKCKEVNLLRRIYDRK